MHAEEARCCSCPGERSCFQINAGIAAKLKQDRGKAWSELYDDAKRKLIRDTIALPEEELPTRNPRDRQDLPRDGFTIEKLVMKVDDGFELPALLFVPEKAKGTATLYLHGGSMQADAATGGPIEKLVREGEIVLAAELRGIGETETGLRKTAYGRGRFGRDLLEVLTVYLMGGSYVGMRTEDVQAWTRHLQTKAKLRCSVDGGGRGRDSRVACRGPGAVSV
jgi:hypothetical protein